MKLEISSEATVGRVVRQAFGSYRQVIHQFLESGLPLAEVDGVNPNHRDANTALRIAARRGNFPVRVLMRDGRNYLARAEEGEAER